MNQVFLNDKDVNQNLFPLTLTRSAADIRIGILTIREKWNHLLRKPVGFITGEQSSGQGESTSVSSSIVPSAAFVASSDHSLAKSIKYPWDIFLLNDWALREDFSLITKGRSSEPIPASVGVINPAGVFIEPGSKLSHCIINAETGPVYIGKDAEIMEGATLRGPIAICNNAVVKMGAKIYGATTIGPYSIVGGEIKNSVIFGYSNKSHDGYLGDSVIGEWCNLGAGTSNSNMKNNVSEVRVWNYLQKDVIGTGTKKCGLIMGDYSRSAINTSFNTGTVVGVCANVFGEGLVSKFVPSFSWGKNGLRYEFNKAVDDVSKWMQLKGQSLNEEQKTRLKLIFDDTNF
ncbi:MAG: glucose-1-phosphate thymidylyltransferase [Chitinophagaceae bacterium]|nr:glucose-1-phosphate thymidylyltransferase [Chitinophagaceae bacterium]